ncbi:MAG: hypothetical protein IPP79_21450 [Chitinophagaceae bacterium]|nr:hypothetical protein [Chitinophagaceae bacterium]
MGKQEKHYKKYKVRKPVVLVLIKSSFIDQLGANIPSIIDAWYPGMEGGNAIG